MTHERPEAGAIRSLPWLRLTHLAAGLLGVVAFVLTGQYMDASLDHLRGMPDALRTLYRSGHIYILFAGLLHLLLGAYLQLKRPTVVTVMQVAGSVLLFAALALFLYGFFVETPLGAVERPMTRTGTEFCLYGVGLHALAVALSRFAPKASPH